MVKIPDPKEQWKKTPGWRLVYETYLDPMTGEEIEIPRRRPWLEQTNEETVVLRWSDIRNKFLLAGGHKKEDLKRRLKHAGGKPKRDTKKGILAGVIELYKQREVTDEELDGKSIEEFEVELDEWFRRAGRWGLGCPHLCGRFWEFKPTEDFTFFEPVDRMAFTPFVDDEGVSHNGYLEWNWIYDVAGNLVGARFICDRCQKEVTLS